MSVTAIFGGTFNPLHIGHYRILEALQNDSDVDKIWIMPDKIPPHKECDFLADDETRIKMCEIAAKDFSKAEVCLIEFEREGKSYTFDTLTRLKSLYPTEDFLLVFGGDMLISFDRWYNFKEIMKMAQFIAFRREDTDNGLFDSAVLKHSKMGMKIKVMSEFIPTVSSTEIRENFENNSDLLPEKIFEFLQKEGVYA